MAFVAALILVELFVATATVVAQETQSPPPAPEASPPVDVSRLGVSLDRIRRELVQSADETQRSDAPLRLSFTVEVVGQAPKINLLEGFPLVGPAPYGGPTHQDVIDFLTPQAYKSPVIPFSAIAGWAAEKLSQRSKKQRCEEELAEYKRMVMAGIAVAAPRCTQ
jgi:hypothetical protein